jgi:hypothetical protein
MNAQTMAKQFAGIRDLVGLDENGEPNGELNESARQLLGPPSRRDAAVLGKLLPDIQRVLASNGITSIQDASLNPSFLPYLKNFENSGDMRFRIQVATRLVPADFTDSLTGKIDIDQMMAIVESAARICRLEVDSSHGRENLCRWRARGQPLCRSAHVAQRGGARVLSPATIPLR